MVEDNIKAVRLREEKEIVISKWKEDSTNVGELIERIDITTERMKGNTSTSKRMEKVVVIITEPTERTDADTGSEKEEIEEDTAIAAELEVMEN